MNLTKMIYALGIVLLLLAGCQSTQEITTEELIGQWDLSPETGLPVGAFVFYPDGTFSIFGLDSGRYELEGTTLTFISSGSLMCLSQDGRGIYQVKRTRDGIHLLLQEDTCDMRSWALTEPLTRTPPQFSRQPEPHKVPAAPTVVSVQLAPAAPVLDPQGTSATDANSVNDLLPVGDDLWVATDGGVLHWDLAEGTSMQYTSEHGLASNDVFAIAVDGEGALWFGTSRGVSRFDGVNWTTYTEADGLARDGVTAIAVDGEGAIWVVTYGGWVSRFDGESWTTYPHKVGLGGANALAIAVDGEGALWFGTSRGVTRFDGENWLTYGGRDAPEGEGANAIAVDGEGALWFGTQGHGVSRLDGRGWATYTEVNGLADNVVNAIAVDGEGVLWFGTSGGVSRFDGQTWTTYAVEDVN